MMMVIRSANRPERIAGDLFLDTSTGNVDELAAGTWTLEGNIEGPAGTTGLTGAVGGQGPQGSTGAPGVAGARGSLWSTGTGAPSLVTGRADGDLYLDTASGNVYELLSGTWTLEQHRRTDGATRYQPSNGSSGSRRPYRSNGSSWSPGSSRTYRTRGSERRHI
jgi:hypothetical protein